MGDKTGRKFTYEDAGTLAKYYAALVPSTAAFSDFVQDRM